MQTYAQEATSHSHDQNPTLDEIESMAAVAARFWFSEGSDAADDYLAGQGGRPAAIAGYQIAAALVFLAERQVDAAGRIADGLHAIATAMSGRQQA
jgi:hypothetical protein